MEALGVGSDRFAVLPDVEIEKYSRGNPTGVIHGYTWLFLALEGMVPQPTFDEQVNSLVSSVHGLNRFGVTTIMAAGGLTPRSRRG